MNISQTSYKRIYDFFFVIINWYDWLQIKICISWSMNSWNFCRIFKILVELFSVKMTKLFSPIVHGLGWWRSSFLAKIAVLFYFFHPFLKKPYFDLTDFFTPSSHQSSSLQSHLLVTVAVAPGQWGSLQPAESGLAEHFQIKWDQSYISSIL